MSLLQLFNSKGRFSRKQYIFVTLCGYLILILIYSLLALTSRIKVLIYINFGILVLYFFLLAIVLTMSIIKRLHDLGYPGNYYWKLHIPIAGQFLFYRLLLEKGQILDNEYGPTTWTQKEREKIKPSSLKMKVNELTKKNLKKKKKITRLHQSDPEQRCDFSKD